MQTVKRRCAQTARISLHSIKMSKSVSSEQNRTSRQFPSVTSSASSSDFPNLRVCSCICFRPSPSLFRFGEPVSTEPRKRPQEVNEGMSPFFCCTCFSTQNLGVDGISTTRKAASQHDFFCAAPFRRCGKFSYPQTQAIADWRGRAFQTRRPSRITATPR